MGQKGLAETKLPKPKTTGPIPKMGRNVTKPLCKCYTQVCYVVRCEVCFDWLKYVRKTKIKYVRKTKIKHECKTKKNMYARLKKNMYAKLKTKKCKCHFYATVILLYEHNF
jgi:hypothetical protein